jgi:hypothetical protein
VRELAQVIRILSPSQPSFYLFTGYRDTTKFSELHGIESLMCVGELIGETDFLNPFVTYDRETFWLFGNLRDAWLDWQIQPPDVAKKTETSLHIRDLPIP